MPNIGFDPGAMSIYQHLTIYSAQRGPNIGFDHSLLLLEAAPQKEEYVLIDFFNTMLDVHA